MEVDKDTKLKTILDNGEAGKILAKHQVPCMGCPMASLEMDKLTLGQICEAYGLDFEEIKDDLQELE